MACRRKPLDVVLIAEHANRVALLQRLMQQIGLNGSIRTLRPSAQVSAYLRKQSPYENTPLPDLVLIDVAEAEERITGLLWSIAFAKQRTSAPVVLLTSPTTETMLESGDIDSGDVTMFSPRTLTSLLQKLAGSHGDEFLEALATLYQYGPILARQPARFLKYRDTDTQLSA